MSDEPKKEKRSLLGRDLDALVLLMKRAAAMGAAFGFIHHMFMRHC